MSTLDASANAQAEADAKTAAAVIPPLNPPFPGLVAPFDVWFFDLQSPHPASEGSVDTAPSRNE